MGHYKRMLIEKQDEELNRNGHSSSTDHEFIMSPEYSEWLDREARDEEYKLSEMLINSILHGDGRQGRCL